MSVADTLIYELDDKTTSEVRQGKGTRIEGRAVMKE